MATEWYFAANDTPQGPVEQAEIERLIALRHLTPATLVWRDGLNDWEEAGRHFSFPSAMPPPLPARPNSQSATPAPTAHLDADTDLPRMAPAARFPKQSLARYTPYPGAPARGFPEAINTCFRRYFDFSGRASRSEFWCFYLFSFFLGLATAFVSALYNALIYADLTAESPLFVIVILAMLIPYASATCRRLHDTNRSGWWVGSKWLLILG